MDEDDTPRPRRPLPLPDRDDDEDAPRARKSRPDRDDEDDAPRSRKSRPTRDDEDDDAPRGRRSRADRDDHDDEDDDRPRSRRSTRDRDDEDDDDRPSRPRRKKKQKQGGNGLLIGAVAGGGVLLLLGAGGLVWALSGKKSEPQKDVAANQPANVMPGGNSTPPGGNFASVNPTAGNNQQTIAPPVSTGPVAMNGELTRDVEERTRRATAFIQVDVGGKSASGSGFILKSNGDTAYIVTNFHVVSGPQETQPPPQANPGPPGFPSRPGFPGRPGFPPRPPSFRPPGFPGGPRFGPAAGRQQEPPKVKPRVTVILNSNTPEEQSVQAEVVAVDDDADLATLRITGARNLPAAIDMVQEAPVAETMPVFIFGFPGGVRSVVIKKGSVSQLRRDQNNELNDMQINGEIIPGNSGGPVVDAQGRLVGIAVSTVVGKNVGFAIPTAQLNHMLRGGVRLGLVGQLIQRGSQVELIGEGWVFDGKSRVRDRDVLQIPLGDVVGRADLPTDEYLVMARLTDPMHKINSTTMHYSTVPSGTVFQPGAQGWAPLANAQQIPLQISDQHATGKLKLPAGAVRDQLYAFQVSYVNADGQTVYTHPHQVRLTFPKNTKTVFVRITTPKDEPSRRYIDETVGKVFAGVNQRRVRTPEGLHVELEPVDDPKTVVEKIKFGEVTSVQGWTITVVVKKVDLPSPDPAQIAKDLADLKDTQDRKVRKAAAERLSRVYTILPDRRVEVAKGLEELVSEKDHSTRMAAVNALALWAGPENVAGLAKALDTDNVFERQAIVPIIAKYKDPVAAPALAKLLPGLGDRAAASAALKAIGPAAEKAVIPYVSHSDFWTAAEACNILKEIGSAESLPPIKAVLAKKPHFLVTQAGNNAVKAIEARKKSGN